VTSKDTKNENPSGNEKLLPVEAVWPSVSCKIALVGEAPGETEALEGKPFIGSSGRLLDGMLRAAGIDRSQCLVTNVFTQRPPGNQVGYFFGKTGDVRKDLPPFQKHGFLQGRWSSELERLADELKRFEPNVVVALGATPLWALCERNGITAFRGTVMASTLVPGLKVIPTFHPAYIMRQYDERPTATADLTKAVVESAFPEIRRIEREIWIEPSWGDIQLFERRHMQDVSILTYDIETDPWTSKEMLCIGIAPDARHALVIPFVDKRKPGWNYWASADEELKVWKWVAHWLQRTDIRKQAQNGLYDIQWLARYGIKVRGQTEDTMLLHHSLQPELRKGLDYLGSMYANEAAWKTMVSFKHNGNSKKA
jgi:Uracil-DNA glycosylase